jgi:hypothetical protein
MRFIVLAEPHDAGAREVAAELIRRHGAAATIVASSADLAQARWRHRIDERGVTTQITLRDGTMIRHDASTVILNRLTSIAPPLSDDADRNYASMEWTALVWSWLASQAPRVIDCTGLTRGRETPAVRLVRAARAGHVTRGFRLTTRARDGRHDWDVLRRSRGRFIADDGVVRALGTAALFLEPVTDPEQQFESDDPFARLTWALRTRDGARVLARIDANPNLNTTGNVCVVADHMEHSAQETS